MMDIPQQAWFLRVTTGPAEGVLVPLGPGQTVLGRTVQPGDIDLRDDSISRRHAVVTVSRTDLSISDAGSTNGTFVNGRRARGRVVLSHGDRITIGETELVTEGTLAPDGGSTRRVTAEDVAAAVQPSLLTILFTDLVESTKMAHALGDDTAVRILGVHDELVRRSVAANGGREVKHTGDGIMAAFPSAAGGVQAAVDIMRGIAEHNAGVDEPELLIRIGLNAGEPLASGGDLYGLAVSLAARLCDAADPSTILASEAVRVLCLGKGKQFEDCGQRTFKGIETPVGICRVLWHDTEGNSGVV